MEEVKLTNKITSIVAKIRELKRELAITKKKFLENNLPYKPGDKVYVDTSYNPGYYVIKSIFRFDEVTGVLGMHLCPIKKNGEPSKKYVIRYVPYNSIKSDKNAKI